jgi:hypothetical protein
MESCSRGQQSSIYVGGGALELATAAQTGKVALSSGTSNVPRMGKVATERESKTGKVARERVPEGESSKKRPA